MLVILARLAGLWLGRSFWLVGLCIPVRSRGWCDEIVGSIPRVIQNPRSASERLWGAKKNFFCTWSTSKTGKKKSSRRDFGKFDWHPSCFIVCDDAGKLFYSCCFAKYRKSRCTGITGAKQMKSRILSPPKSHEFQFFSSFLGNKFWSKTRCIHFTPPFQKKNPLKPSIRPASHLCCRPTGGYLQRLF